MEKVGIYYTCSAQNYVNNYCGQKIEENLLKILVMDQIQILIKSMCDRKKLLQRLKSDSSEKNAFYEAGAKVRMLERKIAQAEEKNTVLYEDYVGWDCRKRGLRYDERALYPRVTKSEG